jgi:EVE domain
MNYWLQLFTPDTWMRFRVHGADVTGFTSRQRKAAFERVQKGDLLLCYLVKLSRWCGVLEVISKAFEDYRPLFVEEEDPYSVRFKVKAHVLLDFDRAIPMEVPFLWAKLSLTKGLVVGSKGWAQRAKLRQSLLRLKEDDGAYLTQVLQKQSRARKEYAIHAEDRTHLPFLESNR